MKHRRVLRSSALCTAVSLVVANSPFAANAVNLLVNPGFEAPTPNPSENTTCTGWTFTGTAKRATFANHTPGGQFMIWARTWEPLGGGVTQDVTNITPGETYDFSAYLFFEAGFATIPEDPQDPVAAQLQMTWLDSGGTPVDLPTTLSIFPSTAPPASMWTFYEISAVAPVGAAKVKTFVGWQNGDAGTGGQSVFFDDAVLDGPGIAPTGSTWAVDASGDWNLSGSWANGLVPNAVGAEAFFLSMLTAPHTIYSDIAVTVGSMTFDNANTYVISGAGSLSVEVASGSGQISAISGSHKINLPLTFVSNATVTVAGGATLTLADPVIIKANKTVTRAGAGSFLIQAPLTIEAGGTLALGPAPATLFGAPSLASGAKVDVGTQSLTIDYRGTVSPATAIKAQLTSGYNNGAWTGEGIQTSAGTSTRGLGWVDSPGTESILVKYTYYGDANLSGTVDSTDFNALLAGYGQTTTGIWADGDFNYDGKVNTEDFNYVAGNFGAAPISAPGLGAVVPEPISGTTLALLGLLATARRRSR